MIIKVSLTIYYYILFFEVLFYDSKNLDKGERIVLPGVQILKFSTNHHPKTGYSLSAYPKVVSCDFIRKKGVSNTDTLILTY